MTNCGIFANARSSSADEQGTDNKAGAAASCSDLDVFACQSNQLENKKQHVLSDEPNNKQQHQQQQQQQPDVQQQTQLHSDQQSAQSSRSQCVTPQAPAQPPPPEAQGSFSMNAAADWDEGYLGEPQQAPPAAELQDLPPMLPSRQEWQEAASSTGVQPHVPIASDVQRWLGQLRVVLTALQSPHMLEALPNMEAEFIQLVHSGLRDPQDMQGGQLAAYLPVWEELASNLPPGADREAFDLPLSWLREGVPLWFCTTDQHRAAKEREPRREKKRQELLQALREAGLTRAQALCALGEGFPQSFVFGNRLQDAPNQQFARAQVHIPVDVCAAVTGWCIKMWVYLHCTM